MMQENRVKQKKIGAKGGRKFLGFSLPPSVLSSAVYTCPFIVVVNAGWLISPSLSSEFADNEVM